MFCRRFANTAVPILSFSSSCFVYKVAPIVALTELFRPELALHADLFPIRTANARNFERERQFGPSLCRVVSHHRKKVDRVNVLHADNTGWRVQLTAATLARVSRAAIKQRAVRRSRRKVGRPTMQRQGLFQKTQHVELHLADLTLSVRVMTVALSARCNTFIGYGRKMLAMRKFPCVRYMNLP